MSIFHLHLEFTGNYSLLFSISSFHVSSSWCQIGGKKYIFFIYGEFITYSSLMLKCHLLFFLGETKRNKMKHFCLFICLFYVCVHVHVHQLKTYHKEWMGWKWNYIIKVSACLQKHFIGIYCLYRGSILASEKKMFLLLNTQHMKYIQDLLLLCNPVIGYYHC